MNFFKNGNNINRLTGLKNEFVVMGGGKGGIDWEFDIDMYTQLYIYIYIYILFFFLLLAVLDPHCRVQAFSSCGGQGLLFSGSMSFPLSALSCCGAGVPGTQALLIAARRLRSCGSQARELWHVEY